MINQVQIIKLHIISFEQTLICTVCTIYHGYQYKSELSLCADFVLSGRAGFRHVEAPGQPSVVEAHPTLEY